MSTVSDAVGPAAVCVRFRLTRAEYQAAMVRLCMGLWFYRVFAALSALAFVVGIVLTLTGDASLGLPIIGVAIVWSLLTAGSLFVGPILQ